MRDHTPLSRPEDARHIAMLRLATVCAAAICALGVIALIAMLIARNA